MLVYLNPIVYSLTNNSFFIVHYCMLDDESGNAIATPRGTEVTVQLKVMTPAEHVSLSEDEEG